MNTARIAPAILFPVPTHHGLTGVALYALAMVAVTVLFYMFRSPKGVF
jgi:hypothetical protein